MAKGKPTRGCCGDSGLSSAVMVSWMILAIVLCCIAGVCLLQPPNMMVGWIFGVGWVTGCATTVVCIFGCTASQTGDHVSDDETMLKEKKTSVKTHGPKAGDDDAGSIPDIIYVTPQGSHFHSKPNKCPGLNTAGSKRDAKLPCKFCYGHRG